MGAYFSDIYPVCLTSYVLLFCHGLVNGQWEYHFFNDATFGYNTSMETPYLGDPIHSLPAGLVVLGVLAETIFRVAERKDNRQRVSLTNGKLKLKAHVELI